MEAAEEQNTATEETTTPTVEAPADASQAQEEEAGTPAAEVEGSPAPYDESTEGADFEELKRQHLEATEEQTPPAAEVEPKAAEEKPEERRERSISSRLAELAKRSKRLDGREQALAQREQAVEAQLRQIRDALGHLKQNPPEALASLGLTPEDVHRFVSEFLDGTKVDPQVAQVKKEIEQLKRTQAEEAARLQQTHADAELARFRSSVVGQLSQGGERWELVRALGREEDVYGAIELHAQRQLEAGVHPSEIEFLSTEAAADAVEAFLESEAERYRETGKLKKKWGQGAPQKTTQSKKGEQVQGSAPRREGPRSAAALPLARRGAQVHAVSEEQEWEEMKAQMGLHQPRR